jgi:hypothetical protein
VGDVIEGEAGVSTDRTESLRCPVCGEGVLRDIAYDEHHPDLEKPKQAPESQEVVSFTCGHEVEGRFLAEAARNDSNVERREAEDTVTPPDPEGAPS